MKNQTTAPDPRVELWDAIHAYVRACGGDPAKHVYGNMSRMRAVIEVEAAARKMGDNR